MLVVNKKIGANRVSFSPEFYKLAIRSFEQGKYSDLIALMKKASFDSHVTGCLLGRRAGFQKEWTIKPFEESQADEQRAEWIKTMLSRINTRKLFKKVHDAVLYKYSVVDFEWEVQDSKQVITNFKAFDQKYFKYDDDGILKIDFGKSLKDIPEQVLICENDETPAMLPVLRDYILKDFGLESWASFIETFGEGILIGKYPAGVDQKIIDELNTALDAIAASSRGSMPDETKVEIIEAQRTTGDHSKFEDRCNIAMSITLLGHANAVQDSPGMQVGENLGPFKVRRDISLDDIYFIEPCMNKLIKIICDQNFSDGRYPLFVIDKSEPINVGDRLDTIDLGYRVGLRINPDEFRRLGLMVYEDQDELIKTDPFNVGD